MPIILEKMTPTEFDKHVKDSVQDYAEYMVEQGEFPNVGISLKAAAAEIIPYFAGLKPEEPTFAYHIVDAVTKERAGKLVYTHLLGREKGKQVAFIDWIGIFKEHRRKHFARDAMLAIEKDVKKAGIDIIDLNVMLYKVGAQALYTGLGYSYYRPRYFGPNPSEITRFDMRKILV